MLLRDKKGRFLSEEEIAGGKNVDTFTKIAAEVTSGFYYLRNFFFKNFYSF